jgi:hypothetical protein
VARALRGTGACVFALRDLPRGAELASAARSAALAAAPLLERVRAWADEAGELSALSTHLVAAAPRPEAPEDAAGLLRLSCGGEAYVHRARSRVPRNASPARAHDMCMSLFVDVAADVLRACGRSAGEAARLAALADDRVGISATSLATQRLADSPSLRGRGLVYVAMPPHVDCSLLSCVVFRADDPALRIFVRGVGGAGAWRPAAELRETLPGAGAAARGAGAGAPAPAPASERMPLLVAVLAGHLLEVALGGAVRAALHEVRLPPDRGDRTTTVFRLLPQPHANLDFGAAGAGAGAGADAAAGAGAGVGDDGSGGGNGDGAARTLARTVMAEFRAATTTCGLADGGSGGGSGSSGGGGGGDGGGGDEAFDVVVHLENCEEPLVFCVTAATRVEELLFAADARWPTSGGIERLRITYDGERLEASSQLRSYEVRAGGIFSVTAVRCGD